MLCKCIYVNNMTYVNNNRCNDHSKFREVLHHPHCFHHLGSALDTCIDFVTCSCFEEVMQNLLPKYLLHIWMYYHNSLFVKKKLGLLLALAIISDSAPVTE